MPQLKIFAACEKVINDSEGPASLISIFQRMNIQRTTQELPERAISPIVWSIFSLWELNPEDFGREYTQIVKFYAPDKTLFMETESAFNTVDPNDFQQRIQIRLMGLPIWSEGFAEAQVWLKGNETPYGSYKFEIKYVEVPNAISVQAEQEQS